MYKQKTWLSQLENATEVTISSQGKCVLLHFV